MKRFLLHKILNDPTYGMIFDKKEFITPSPYTFNHNGYKIDAIFETAYEEDTRGYICHRLNLVHDKSSIGYLKVFYLPEKSFEKLYPDIIHWLSQYKGHLYGLATHPKNIDTSDNDSWVNLSEDKKKKVISSISANFDYTLHMQLTKSFNDKDFNLDIAYQRLLNIANERYKKELAVFKKTHIGKATIEFSKIKSPDERMYQTHWSDEISSYCRKKNISVDELGCEDGISLIRTGLGEKMYLLMADWMGINNITLKKSGTNEISESLWVNKIQGNKKFNTIKDSKNVYIDHTHKDCSYLLNNNKPKVLNKM